MELYQRDYRSTSGEWRQEWVQVPTPQPLWLVVRNALLNALAFTSGDQERAARWLQLTPRTMAYQMQTHHIPRALAGAPGRHRRKDS